MPDQPLAPVIDLARQRRIRTARRLQALGVPLERITATVNDTELAELEHRELLVASLRHLGTHLPDIAARSVNEIAAVRDAAIRDIAGMRGQSVAATITAITGRRRRTA